MFDQSAAVTYRGFDFNDAERNAAAGPLVGCLLEKIGWPGLAGVGYVEKRARGDGADASDVYLPARRFTMSGTIYGATRADTFDRLNDLIAALTPTLAYDDDADAHGYLPLAGTQPTDRTDDFSSGSKSLYINCRPVAQPSLDFDRDRTGGQDSKGFGIGWSVQMEAIDPRVYVSEEVEATLGASGTLDNRGNYPTPLTITVTGTAGSTVRFEGLGCDLTITVEDADGTYVLDAAKKTLTETLGGQTALRGDLVTFDAERMYPFVPAGGGSYTKTTTGTPVAVVTYHEAYI